MAQSVTVRFFGRMHNLRADRGLPSVTQVPVPDEGLTAAALAAQLELPADEIEGVFCNHRVYGLDHVLLPGDAVAFVPRGTPGPHRFTLGLYHAGKAGHDRS